MRRPARRSASRSRQTGAAKGATRSATASSSSTSVLRLDLVEPEAPAQRVVMREEALDHGMEVLWAGEVHDAQGAPADAVLVGRADAALGGADAQAGIDALARRVELAVDREDERGVLGDLERVGRHVDALHGQPVHLRDERVWIDHDAVADHRERAPHDAGRQQRELVGHTVDDERVARIVPALEAHHDIGPRRQPIDDLALALVPHCEPTTVTLVISERIPLRGTSGRRPEGSARRPSGRRRCRRSPYPDGCGESRVLGGGWGSVRVASPPIVMAGLDPAIALAARNEGSAARIERSPGQARGCRWGAFQTETRPGGGRGSA